MGDRNDTHCPNEWPNANALPNFRDVMENAFDRLGKINAIIMEALEMALNIPNGTFLDRITQSNNACEMRLNHYPAIDIKEIKSGGVSRIWPHFDLGVITLLFQDGAGGLEFEDRERGGGIFQRVDCGSLSELVVNVSETLQRWTDSRLLAGLHRVGLPSHLEQDENGTLPERFSIAYFCKADRNASVGSLREFVAEGGKPKFEEISAIDYHRQRLESAY